MDRGVCPFAVPPAALLWAAVLACAGGPAGVKEAAAADGAFRFNLWRTATGAAALLCASSGAVCVPCTAAAAEAEPLCSAPILTLALVRGADGTAGLGTVAAEAGAPAEAAGVADLQLDWQQQQH